MSHFGSAAKSFIFLTKASQLLVSVGPAHHVANFVIWLVISCQLSVASRTAVIPLESFVKPSTRGSTNINEPILKRGQHLGASLAKQTLALKNIRWDAFWLWPAQVLYGSLAFRLRFAATRSLISTGSPSR